jgi:hypothetical protein
VLERIYKPTDKDLLSGIQHSRYFLTTNASASATQVSGTQFTIPPDRMRVLTGFWGRGSPGAAQFFEYLSMQVFPSNQVVAAMNIFAGPPTRTVAVQSTAWWNGEVWLYPGDVVVLSGFFNAGAAANSLDTTVFGWDIPRGNFN